MSPLTHPEVTADSCPAVYFAQITAYKTHLPYSTLVQFLFTHFPEFIFIQFLLLDHSIAPNYHDILNFNFKQTLSHFASHTVFLFLLNDVIYFHYTKNNGSTDGNLFMHCCGSCGDCWTIFTVKDCAKGSRDAVCFLAGQSAAV